MKLCTLLPTKRYHGTEPVLTVPTCSGLWTRLHLCISPSVLPALLCPLIGDSLSRLSIGSLPVGCCCCFFCPFAPRSGRSVSVFVWCRFLWWIFGCWACSRLLLRTSSLCPLPLPPQLYLLFVVSCCSFGDPFFSVLWFGLPDNAFVLSLLFAYICHSQP